MESSISTTTITTLGLNAEEAIWLKSLIQNPIGYTMENEPEYEKNMRKNFWKALNKSKGGG